jgi:hypothetical protein
MSKQLDGFEPKDIIKTVTGKVTRLYEPKTFQGERGEFTVQNGLIEVDGDILALKFWNQTQPTEMAGKTVTLSSTRSKHGLNGVVMDHESYDKKDGTHVDQDVIKVSKTGKVEWEGAPVAKPAPVSNPATKKSIETIVADNDPKQALDQLAEQHMYIDALVRHAYKSRDYAEETLRSYVSSIYIEANKRGIVVDTKPSKPAETFDPKDWGSVVVPEGHPKFMDLGGKKLAEVGKQGLVRLHQYFLENPSDKPIARAVEQAAEDFQLGGTEEVEDDIPW